MKLDLERVRKILVDCEDSSDREFSLSDYDEFDRYQIEKMGDEGIVRIDQDRFLSREANPLGLAQRVRVTFELTWKGHGFVEATRDPGIWQKTKETVANEGGSFTFEFVKSIATAIAKKQVEGKTGLKL